MESAKRKLLIASLLFIAGCLIQVCIQQTFKAYVREGIYFYGWSSEDLMQTISLEDLKSHPLISIMNDHIQPPLLDILRAVIAGFFSHTSLPLLLHNVDSVIFMLWTGIYGLMGALVFIWLRDKLPSALAVGFAVAFLLHPATLLYVSIPDTTFLTTFLIFLAVYQLWRFTQNPEGPILPFTFTVVLLFFTRSIFQWPALVLFGVSLLLLGIPKRNLIIYLITVLLCVIPYLGKQYSKFGILSTSSFTGINLMNSIGHNLMVEYWKYDLSASTHAISGNGKPVVLTREKKFTGTPNFNHYGYLQLNKQLMDRYSEKLSGMSMAELNANYLENFRIYMSPSSSFDDTVVTEALPWKSLYDTLFSSYMLAGLVASVTLFSLLNSSLHEMRQNLALTLPVLFIFFVSVLCEKGDNMRFKYFIEPILFVFIVRGLYGLVQRIRSHLVTS